MPYKINRGAALRSIYASLGAGQTEKEACDTAKIDVATLRRWKAKKPEIRERIARLKFESVISAGLTEQAARDRAGVDAPTVQAWRDSDAEFATRIDALMGNARIRAEQRLHALQTQDRNLNVALIATLFELKCQFGWIERQHVTHETPQDTEQLVLVTDLSEIKAREKVNMEADILLTRATLEARRVAIEAQASQDSAPNGDGENGAEP